MCNEIPEAATVLKTYNREVTGRPRIEVDQPELLKAIVDIVTASSAAQDRRRCEELRTVTTLDDLCAKLQKIDFKIKRSSVYLRLLPRRGNTAEGKRHVQTVPVKLLRPENNLRKKNQDRMFAKSFVDDMFSIAKLFGPQVVLFLSCDDKAKVPLGLAAANLQAPLIMHLDYKVSLPDHNFVVASKHKLTPSVYGVCEITQKGDISYSGDTFVRIRSAKHDSSNAYTHAYDLRELFKCKNIEMKPILLIESDGASDEAPRFPKPMHNNIYLFKEFDCDVVIHAVNASGCSAFNPVERRMAPLSHDICGVLLPHDYYGSHLDAQGRTTDEELEKTNFFHAAESLADIWSQTVIDGHKVDAKAVPVNQTFVAPAPDPSWVSKHVQQSRYAIQIVKCHDRNCCKPFKTNWKNVFPERFVPVPAVNEYGIRGLQAVEPAVVVKNPRKYSFAPLQQRLQCQKLPEVAEQYTQVPFDLYCPSMTHSLSKGICAKCGQYWPSGAAMKRHAKCHRKSTTTVTEDQEVDESTSDDDDDDTCDKREREHTTGDEDRIPVFNIFELFKNPAFTEIDNEHDASDEN